MIGYDPSTLDGASGVDAAAKRQSLILQRMQQLEMEKQAAAKLAFDKEQEQNKISMFQQSMGWDQSKFGMERQDKSADRSIHMKALEGDLEYKRGQMASDNWKNQLAYGKHAQDIDAGNKLSLILSKKYGIEFPQDVGLDATNKLSADLHQVDSANKPHASDLGTTMEAVRKEHPEYSPTQVVQAAHDMMKNVTDPYRIVNSGMRQLDQMEKDVLAKYRVLDKINGGTKLDEILANPDAAGLNRQMAENMISELSQIAGKRQWLMKYNKMPENITTSPASTGAPSSGGASRPTKKVYNEKTGRIEDVPIA